MTLEAPVEGRSVPEVEQAFAVAVVAVVAAAAAAVDLAVVALVEEWVAELERLGLGEVPPLPMVVA